MTQPAPATVGWVPSSRRSTRSCRWPRTCGCSRGWRSCRPEAAVARMLAQTGLEDRADDEVGRLSGGNQQRVNIAIGLLCEPAVLLLDEPSASLDPRQRERLWEFIGGAGRRRHDRRLLDPQRRRGRALRRPGAGAGRRRAAVHRHPRRARAGGGRQIRATSRPRSSASCTSAATERAADALAARQGPADPQALAAAGGAAGRLSGRDRADDRLRALEPARASRRWRSTARSRPARARSSFGSQQINVSSYASELFQSIQPIRVHSRDEAIAKVRDGEALAALIIPADIPRRSRAWSPRASAARRSS